ncbi:MAG: winged helix-turn-helix domain-containing protein [Nitrososphaerales archaeon]
MHKRSRFELYGDILLAIREDVDKNSTARLTRVYGKANVPYDRFKGYINDLRKNALIEISVVNDHEEIKVTKRGFEYIQEYVHVDKFLIAFGLREKHHDLE